LEVEVEELELQAVTGRRAYPATTPREVAVT
jgi:hypothetical protein